MAPLCPLLRQPCLMDGCAWWIAPYKKIPGGCSIQKIAIELGNIEFDLDDSRTLYEICGGR